jgi:N-acetylglucosamine-6-phosphate deacetylase
VRAGYVYFENGKITAVGDEALPFDREVEAGDGYVLPGLCDLHTHGALGFDFCECDREGALAAIRFHLQHGTTCILPTLSTAPFAVMRKSALQIKEAMESGKAPTALGIHMEGPYFSVKQCGAQNTDFITPPVKEEYETLIAECEGTLKRWSYAPEYDQDAVFCKYLTDHGVIASVGHSDAIYDDLKPAMQNGMNLVTHLYSCTSTITRDHGFRRLGVIETAYLEDDLYIEIICDGKHLPPELIRMILKCKDNDKIALITDSMEIAGTSEKIRTLAGRQFIVEDGVCKLMDRSAFAGSIATADVLIRTLTKECDVPVPAAVKMLTKVPAEILQVNKGELKVGRDADVVVFDEDINIRQVFLAGKTVL